MNSLQRLNDWFIAHCDEDWEHCYSIKLETLDNPGWNLSIEIWFEDDEFTEDM